GGTRLWIAGARGFLAYSDDQGRCFTIYEYDQATGDLRPPSESRCKNAVDAKTDASWPALLPTVWAAERPFPQSQSSAQNPSSTNKPYAQSNQADPRTQQNAPSIPLRAISPIQVSQSSLDFHDVPLGTTPPTQSLTIQNVSSDPVQVAFTD